MKQPKGGARSGAGRKSRFDTTCNFRCKASEHAAVRAMGDHRLRFLIRITAKLCLHRDSIVQNQYTRDLACSICGESNPEDFSKLIESAIQLIEESADGADRQV
jgi:hypothetical protein